MLATLNKQLKIGHIWNLMYKVGDPASDILRQNFKQRPPWCRNDTQNYRMDQALSQANDIILVLYDQCGQF